ncbi:MAG: AAC(3) family N-acetyltransferase [Spirochaetales bacterium]|nr:AAC(3) family N-acetyltransferase [Spirochaetales bacterium]MCF7938024.1 AAC(3) family N-acetyltransferase [Spirochaetales bacterium]
MKVLVHSSLSAIGWICGGALTLIEALEEVIRPYGTLVMPAHSGNLSDPAGWENPPVPESWWETIRQQMPAFDPERTPTAGVGSVPELFRNFPGVLRSSHPHFSFAAWGADTEELLDRHELDYGLGEASPLGKLYRADADVLVIGSGFSTNTCFHLAEYRSDYPGKKETEYSAPILVDGHRRWKQFRNLDIDSSDFSKIGNAFLKRKGKHITESRIGYAVSYRFPIREAVDFAENWMKKHRR